ncbi:tenascin-like isoform X2 [Lutzomyia longipalpis]|uniref:tenascin-like isoform X2 n=1 Tax=Lutzomyia longipalpis TaxID=7200 RepID=UPI0024846949|nr:tenascin-like isoform X2 [Lutzomyia longipalpis]
MKFYQIFPLFFLCWTITLINADMANVITYHRDLVDIPCEHEADCHKQVTDEFTICHKKQCTCYDKSGQESLCKPKIFTSANFVGGSCPCPINDTVCDQTRGVCICTEKFTESLDKKSCIPKVVRLNEKCENNGQCLKFELNSECDLNAKVCVCQQNFTQIDDSCQKGATLGTRCRASAECLERTPNSVCLEHKCICEIGFVARKNQTECLPETQYGMSCSESGQCHRLGSGAICDNGLCVCDAAHQNITLGGSTICEKRISVGDTCKEHQQCFHSHPLEQTMECIGGHCQCIEGFSDKNGQCEKNYANIGKIASPILLLICMIVHKILN